MKTNPCEFEGCESKAAARRYCRKHYEYHRRRGSFGALRTHRRGEGNSEVERFWSRVAITSNPDKCWEWQGGRIEGYGTVDIQKKTWRTHRYVWFLMTGNISDLEILHSCDNPPCCNPAHLREGTQQDNMTDKQSKNRQARGSVNGNAKLTETQVREIKIALAKKEVRRTIAARYAVTPTTITGIAKERTWQHIQI
jgi:hypothetical protein